MRVIQHPKVVTEPAWTQPRLELEALASTPLLILVGCVALAAVTMNLAAHFLG